MFKNEGQQNIKNIAVEHQTKQPDFFHTLPEFTRERVLDQRSYANPPDSPTKREVFVQLSLIGVRVHFSLAAKSLLTDLIVTENRWNAFGDLNFLRRYMYLVASARQAGIENFAVPEKGVRAAIIQRLNEMATLEDGRGLASLLFLAKIVFPGEEFINEAYCSRIRNEIAHAKPHAADTGTGGRQRLREVLAHCRLVDPSMIPDLSDAEKAYVYRYDPPNHIRLGIDDLAQLAYARLLAADDVFVDTEGVHVVDHAASATPQTKEMPSARRI